MYMSGISQAYDVIGSMFRLCQGNIKMPSRVGHFQTIATNVRDIFLTTWDVSNMKDGFNQLLPIMFLHTVHPKLNQKQ